MALIISIGVFLTLVAVILLVYQMLTAEQKTMVDRLQKLDAKGVQVEDSVQAAYAGAQPQGLRGLIRRLSKFLVFPKWNRVIELKLLKAGLPLRGAEFLVICIGAALLGGAFVFVASGGNPLIGIGGAFINFWLPFLMVKMRTEKRMKEFNKQLGDALILIANSLRTGYSFMQAVDMVSREMRPPISVEFARTLKEMNLGVTTEEAMGNMAKRIDSDDLDLVITAVLIQRQVGGNLSEVLDNIARTIRERVRIRGEIKTLTAQGRVSGYVVSFLPVGLGLIIYLMNPEYMSLLFTHPVGRLMLVAGLVSQLIGIMLIRRIVDIEM